MLFLLEVFPLLLSSVLLLLLVLLKASITSLQQVVLTGVVILIIVLDRVVLKVKSGVSFVLRLLLLFLISLSIQALVFSTGGFSSPFLILFHLFAISLGFLVDLKTATTFLLFALLTLVIATFLDERLKTVFSTDLGAIALYLLSFLAVIPLSRFVAQKYHLKDALSKLLTHQLSVQKSVLEGLSDIVIITDTSLKILSFNEAATRGLRESPSELIGRSLLEILILKDFNEKLIDKNYLSIEHMLQDKTTRIVKNLLLYVRNSSIPRKVNIQIRPTVNLEGNIDQIACIISDSEGTAKDARRHQDLQEALLKHQAAVGDIYTNLVSRGMIDLARKASLFGKSENDILIALEMQDHGLEPVMEIKDTALILPKIIAIENLFAKSLGVTLRFKIDDKYIEEAAKFVPAGSQFSPSMVTSPFFTVPIDSKWLDLLMFKILDMTTLFVSATRFPLVEIFLSYDSQFVYVEFRINSDLVKFGEERLLFTEYYGRLGIGTNLRLGSGLEGYMAKTITTSLGIPLGIKMNNSEIIISLKLSKSPQTPLDKDHQLVK